MLDKYKSGSVERLSPEAPVLVREAERAVLGGAANVCADLAALGAEVVVVGVIGQDEPGSVVLHLLRVHPKLYADHVVIHPHRPTSCKIRVMSGVHHMVRIGAESRGECCSEVEEAALERVRGSLTVEVHLAPADPRRQQFDAQALAKLKRVLSTISSQFRRRARARRRWSRLTSSSARTFNGTFNTKT